MLLGNKDEGGGDKNKILASTADSSLPSQWSMDNDVATGRDRFLCVKVALCPCVASPRGRTSCLACLLLSVREVGVREIK